MKSTGGHEQCSSTRLNSNSSQKNLDYSKLANINGKQLSHKVSNTTSGHKIEVVNA